MRAPQYGAAPLELPRGPKDHMQRLLDYATHHPGLSLLLGAALLAVLVYELRERTRAVGAISPQDAVRLMNQGATLLDVRDAEAFAAGHIGGARNLPADRLAESLESLKRLKERPLIVYCERGTSAAGALRTLAAQGFTKVVNLRGGLGAWRAENLPVVRG
jgi:rhodanese-related sulfurtransferase